MKLQKLTGLLAAPFTPFDENGNLRLEQIPLQAEALLKDGVKGVYVCGTTGEGISCSVSERLRIFEAWKAAAGDRLILIAHTGALAMEDIRELTHHAQSLGYDAFSVIPTTFFRPGTPEDLVRYCQKVASFAPEMPFYYYHTMNSMVNLSMRDFLEAADGRIPNLAGIKFNHHNLHDYQNALNACDGKYDVVFGVDEFFAGALALGAKSFIGSTYNYSAGLYISIWEAFRKGDWECVRNNMAKVCRGVDLLIKYGGIPAGKAMMLLKGIDCGPARLPLAYLPPEQRRRIADAMGAIVAGE